MVLLAAPVSCDQWGVSMKNALKSCQISDHNDATEATWSMGTLWVKLCKDTGLLSGERGDLCEIAHDWVATQKLTHNEVLTALHNLGFKRLVMGREILEVPPPAPPKAIKLTPGWARPPVL